MLNIGFTGTRHGLKCEQSVSLNVVFERLFLSPAVLHQGDCLGADAQAAVMAKQIGYKLFCHPPTNSALRSYVESDFSADPLPYLARNRVIVRESVVLVACPDGHVERVRSGTWSTVRYARLLQRWVILVFPSGRVTLERDGQSTDW